MLCTYLSVLFACISWTRDLVLATAAEIYNERECTVGSSTARINTYRSASVYVVGEQREGEREEE